MRSDGAAGHEALAELLAREQIRELPLRYARAIEQRDVDAMADLFAPTARFGPHGLGPTGARALMRATMASSRFAVILVANHLIDLDGADDAHGEVWARCYALDDDGSYIEQLIKYVDRYVRVNGAWRFAHRRHHLWFGAAAPSPFEQPPANWPESQIGVGDLPLSDDRFRDWWSERHATAPTDD